MTRRSFRMWISSCFVYFLLTSFFAEGARQNGDPLHIGETVRLHVFVEEDYHFRVVGCGTYQCGGVRVEGVDANGFGYRTFVSQADNEPLRREDKVIRDSLPFGTSFVPGREYTFYIHRPASRRLQIWLEGHDQRKASVKLENGDVQLYVWFKSGGTYRFLDESGSKAVERRKKCTTALLPKAPEPGTTATSSDGETLDVSIGCRYRSDEKLNGMCIVYLAVDGEKGREEVYRSRFSLDDYDPQLKETVKLPFKFADKQNLIFAVYPIYTDCNSPSEEEIHSLETSLGAVNSKGKVELTVKESSVTEYSVQFLLNCHDKITLEMSGKHIAGHGDVFLKILKSQSASPGEKNAAYQDIAKTNTMQRDINFIRWEEITLSLRELCDGDFDRPLKVYAMEETIDGPNFIGYFITTANELKRPKNTFLLINDNEKIRSGGAYNHSGEIYIGEIPQQHTFSQYMAVGFELVGTVQIDFTASNDEVTPSLHDLNADANKYEMAIKSVGEIVENFISDNIFKVYGFGAEVPGKGLQYDFNADLTSNSPDCVGVKGVLTAYREFLPQLVKSGPTYFAPGIMRVVNTASQYIDGSKYFIHLLLTDGSLHDLEETKKAVLQASKLPISIIIVGIGESHFSELSKIIKLSDEDQQSVVVWNEGQRDTRDIVQFVAMKDFDQGNYGTLKILLRRKVLRKIPEQYLEYMKIKKITPKPPRNSTITRECYS